MEDTSKRPVPDTREGFFLKSKNCNERIYIYLLLKSKRRPDGSEDHRYVERPTNYQIANDLGISRNTVGARLKDLKTYGYVTQEGKYYLVPKTDYYDLIPQDTLDFLLNYVEGKDKLIKLYIVLWDYWNAKRVFKISDLHKALGYRMVNGKPDSKNSKYIRTLLVLLEGAGLIKYTIREGRNNHGAPVDEYQLLFVRSHVDQKYKESYKRLRESGAFDNIEEE